MKLQHETPFENLESAFEYIGYLLEASREAQAHIDEEISCANTLQLARRKQALQLTKYKLDKLDSHIVESKHLLNDLRKLRRLILENTRNNSIRRRG
jgi:hypothetical protein